MKIKIVLILFNIFSNYLIAGIIIEGIEFKYYSPEPKHHKDAFICIDLNKNESAKSYVQFSKTNESLILRYSDNTIAKGILAVKHTDNELYYESFYLSKDKCMDYANSNNKRYSKTRY